MEGERYRYLGVPLTATIAAELAEELFRGQISETGQIGDAVLAAHLKRGGIASRGDITRVTRSALSMLRARGTALNVTIGHWQIGPSANGWPHPLVSPEELSPAPGVEDDPNPLPNDVVELGEGPEAVYLYFLPTYKRHAEVTGKPTWPCKIGRTSGDPLARIASQAATALPEPPYMAAVIWSDNSIAWERAFHGVLAARRRRIENALGVEWFETSPQEFVEIASWIEPGLRA